MKYYSTFAHVQSAGPGLPAQCPIRSMCKAQNLHVLNFSAPFVGACSLESKWWRFFRLANTRKHRRACEAGFIEEPGCIYLCNRRSTSQVRLRVNFESSFNWLDSAAARVYLLPVEPCITLSARVITIYFLAPH